MLQVKNIHKQYKTGDLIQTALDNVSLNLRDNEFVAILGPSGSGKTTLLKMLFKELCSQYVVLYCGIDDITGRSQENILKELVQNTFGDDSYSLFHSVTPEKKP